MSAADYTRLGTGGDATPLLRKRERPGRPGLSTMVALEVY
jgi:hypothetical protein